MALAPLGYFFWALGIAAFIVEAWAFIDALRHRSDAYLAAGKQTKNIWLIILGIAVVVGLFYASGRAGVMGVIGILPIAAFIAAAIYLADVRPKLQQFRGGGGGGGGRGGSYGPYGPW